MQKPRPPPWRGFGALQVLDGAADILLRRVVPIEALHQVARLLSIARDLAAKEIRDERPKASAGEPIGDRLDLSIEPPPFLDDDDAGSLCVVIRHGVAVPGGRSPVRTSVFDHLRFHAIPPLRATLAERRAVNPIRVSPRRALGLR